MVVGIADFVIRYAIVLGGHPVVMMVMMAPVRLRRRGGDNRRAPGQGH